VTVNLALSVIIYQAYTLKRLRSHGKQVVALVTSPFHDKGPLYKKKPMKEFSHDSK